MPTFVPEQMHEVVSLQTSGGKKLGVWEVPTTNGGRCVLLNLAGPSEMVVPTRTRNNGGACDLGSHRPQSTPITVALNWLPTEAGGFSVFLDGHVVGTRGIASIELRSSGGGMPLPFRNGYFVGELGSASAAGDMPTKGAPYLVIAHDRRGNEIARVDLAQLVGAASP